MGKSVTKKYRSLIDEIIVELDFDSSRNKNVKYYSVCFKDGSKITGIGMKNLFLNMKNSNRRFV